MKERPIIFSGPMVLAVLAGQKTQHRKPMNRVPGLRSFGGVFYRYINRAGNYAWGSRGGRLISLDNIKCPHGQPGDRLWVRETWQPHPDAGCSFPDFGTIPDDAVGYAADLSAADREESKPWNNACHMPRWASRILLEITDVRTERVQDITEEGAIAEGFTGGSDPGGSWSAREEFIVYWDQRERYGEFGWAANDWVWVIDFKVIWNGGA